MFPHILCLDLFGRSRFGYLNLSKAALFGGIGTLKSYQGDWLGRGSNCLKDLIIVYYFARTHSSGCWEELNEEFNELRETKFYMNGPAMIDLDSDEDLVKRRDEKEKMLKYEEEKKKRRHELMNSYHWKLSVSKICNGKRTQRSSAFSAYYCGNTFAMAEKDRPLNTLNDQDMNLFLKDVTPWVEDLSRYNRATDRVHLTDAFDIFLGRQGPIRCRFPWCKDHVELWVNYMWHFRPHDADWAMVSAYFVQLLLQVSIPSWYADGILYKVSWYDVEEAFSNTSFISTIPSILDSYSKQKMSDYLPIEVQLEIMNKLPVKSLLQFRTVSKLWKSSIDSSNFIFSYGIRKSLSISFVVNYYQGFQSYMGNVNHNFNSTPLNTNLNFSSVFPIATCDGLWCFSYANNFMAIIWNPSIMKSIGVFVLYFTSQVETQRIILGFGVRPDNLDPTLLKISYPYSGEGTWFVSLYTLSTDRWRRLQNLPSQTLRIKNSGQVVVGNFIYWAASDRCGLHDDGVMHTSYVLVSFDMINHQFQIIVIPEPLLVWLVAPFCITQLGNNLVLSANYHVGHSRLLCAWVLEVNGHAVTSYRMIVSVPTPYSSRLLGFNMDEEPIIEVDEIGYQMDTTLQVYNRTHEQFQNLGVEANSGSFFVGAFKESLSHVLSLDVDNPIQTALAYRTDDRGSTMNVGKAECSNCKFLAEKIKTLEAKIKILEGTLEMERHPENHTIESAAILHELFNDMGKLGLE
ncbi:F-box domain containing protein [Tanacetum coccineum]